MKLPGTDVDLDPRLEPLLVPIADLQLDPANPRRVIDIDKLVRRIRRYGYTDPVVVQAETKLVEAGHMRVAACLELGATHVPAVFVGHDPVLGRAFNIAHNRSSEDVADWDREALAELLGALKDEDGFEDIGFDDDDLVALLLDNEDARAKAAAVEAGQGDGESHDEPRGDEDSESTLDAEADDLPETPAEPVTREGETIELGPHTLFCGDCLDLLKTLPDCSVDAVVTDPPYGLSEEPDAAEVLRHWLAGDGSGYEHGGKGFMGAAWDSFVPGPHVWREVLRVLKPGAHVVAFYGTRTYDLGVMAMRLAGFEVREQLAWLHGQGFPKSLNVGKAIDDELGAERKVVGSKLGRPGYHLHPGEHGEAFGSGVSSHTAAQRLAASQITAPATPEAARWDGWGTALKPAMEPIVLARKPLDGTVARNVLRHGTGGVNVDACRVGTDDNLNGGTYSANAAALARESQVPGNGIARPFVQPDGRWPPNVLLEDGEVAAMLDEQSGHLKSGALKPYEQKHVPTSYSTGAFRDVQREASEGGASRFYPRFKYCAKPATSERDEGLEDMPTRSGGELTQRTDGSKGLDSPRAGAGRNGGRKNIHPTVKPAALMRWLLTLCVPPGGTVLEPFAGSGTTLVAAVGMRCRVIAAELLPAHCDIIRGRVEGALRRSAERRAAE